MARHNLQKLLENEESMILEWEIIGKMVFRLRVFGGWMVITQDDEPNVPRVDR